MKFDKKNIYKAISIIIVILTFVWFWNYEQVLNLHFFDKEFTMSLSLYSGFIFLIGFISAEIATKGNREYFLEKIKEYEKKFSTSSVDGDKDKAKIEVLERKIATLEKALECKLEDK